MRENPLFIGVRMYKYGKRLQLIPSCHSKIGMTAVLGCYNNLQPSNLLHVGYFQEKLPGIASRGSYYFSASFTPLIYSASNAPIPSADPSEPPPILRTFGRSYLISSRSYRRQACVLSSPALQEESSFILVT